MNKTQNQNPQKTDEVKAPGCPVFCPYTCLESWKKGQCLIRTPDQVRHMMNVEYLLKQGNEYARTGDIRAFMR
jgi:hypothetical protein